MARKQADAAANFGETAFPMAKPDRSEMLENFPVGLHRAAAMLCTVLAAGGYFLEDPGWSRLFDALLAAPFMFLILFIFLAPLALVFAAAWGFLGGLWEAWEPGQHPRKRFGATMPRAARRAAFPRGRAMKEGRSG